LSALKVALSNSLWTGITIWRARLRQHWEIIRKTEIVLQQGSSLWSFGFQQDPEQIQQPLTRLRNSWPSQLANLDQLSTLCRQPLNGAVRENFEMLAEYVLARI
jgi:hypothetical protein